MGAARVISFWRVAGQFLKISYLMRLLEWSGYWRSAGQAALLLRPVLKPAKIVAPNCEQSYFVCQKLLERSGAAAAAAAGSGGCGWQCGDGDGEWE